LSVNKSPAGEGRRRDSAPAAGLAVSKYGEKKTIFTKPSPGEPIKFAATTDRAEQLN
jgi:hypothetical protein